MLELVDRSQSLILVIEDKNRRYKSSGNNPFSGQLHMVTAPPLSPTILTAIAQSTDFYQVQSSIATTPQHTSMALLLLLHGLFI